MEKTERLYRKNVYLRECSAAVLAAEGSELLLDRSVFAPEAGGQPSDEGRIGPYAVLHVREDGEQLWHRLDAAPEEAAALVGSE